MEIYLFSFALALFAIATPASAQDRLGLELVGQVDGSCGAVAASGDYAFITAYSNNQSTILKTIDISDVTNPTVVSSWEAPSNVWSLAAAGDFVYLGLRDRGVIILDVSDPARPQRLASIETDPYIRSMRLSGDRLYLAVGQAGITVLDVSDPSQPEILIDAAIEGMVFGVAPVGDLVYASCFNGGFQALEMTEDGWNRIGRLLFRNVAYCLAIRGEYAYVGGAPDIGMRVVNIADPANPVEVGHFDELEGEISDIAIKDNLLAVGSSGGVNNAGGGVHLFDISDPENPDYIGYSLQPRSTALVFHGRYILTIGDNFLILDTAPVQESPTISIPEDQLNLDFGEVVAGSVEDRRVTITNIGFPELIIHNLQIDEEAFTVTTPDRIWNSLGGISAGAIVEDTRISGVEFDGQHFYVSGGSNGEMENFIYVFNQNGELVSSFAQFNESVWGMRDLAWDWDLLWGGDEGVIYGFTTEGEQITSFESPVEIARAMTYDNSRELLWVADATSSLYGIDRAGNLVSTIERTWDTRIYGLASSPDDPNLYFFASDERNALAVYRCYPDRGVVEFLHALPGEANERSSGATISVDIFHPATTFIGLIDGEADRIGMWQMTDHYLGGDIVIEPESSIDLDIHFAPLDAQEFNSNLIIISNDPENEEISIPLIGVGVAGGGPDWVDVPDAVVETEGEMIDFQVSGSDPDDQPLTIRWSRDEFPFEARFVDISNGVGRFTWRPEEGSAGEYDLALTLSDGANETTAHIPISILSPNDLKFDDGNMPKSLELASPYPNPFNSQTTLHYAIPSEMEARLVVCDMSGRQLEVLFSGTQRAGRYELRWEADKWSAGLYLIRLTGEGKSAVARALMVK